MAISFTTISSGGGDSFIKPLSQAYQTSMLDAETNSYVNSAAGTVGVPQLIPFIARATDYNRVGARITAVGGANGIRLAVYSSDENGMPKTRVFESGNIDGTTTGDKEAVISGVSFVVGDIYWVGVVKRSAMSLNLLNDPTNIGSLFGNSNATAFFSYLANNAWTGANDEFVAEISTPPTTSNISSGDPINTWLRYGV